MRKSTDKILYILVLIIVIISVVVSSIGVFSTTGGEPYEVTNQYGDVVKIHGDGIYKHDSFFKAPLLRGTDFTILFVVVPLLVLALIKNIRKSSIKRRMFLTSMISVITYYSASVVFGVTYNSLLLLNIALFASSFYGLILAMVSIECKAVKEVIDQSLSNKSIFVFLIITGVVLIIAWLPDIISALRSNRSLAMIEVYTTEITYALDMGIIAPLTFISLVLLQKKQCMGYVLLQILLILCIAIGVMVPLQTIFQTSAGISLPMPVLITKVGSFMALAFFALFLEIRLMKSIIDINVKE